VLATAAHSVSRAVLGEVAYHDPFTNQLYFHGRPLAAKIMNPDVYPDLFFEDAVGLIKNLYALLGSLLVAAVYWLAKRVAGERAGFFAALAAAVQPLFLTQSPHVLPNVAAALLFVLFAGALVPPLSGAQRVLAVAALAGLATAFKFNPVPTVVLLGTVCLDHPTARLRAVGLALVGLLLGFTAGYPTFPWRLREFVSHVATASYHYGSWGHAPFETDAPLAMILHGVYVWPQLPGNSLVLALAVLGGIRLLAAETAGSAWRGWSWAPSCSPRSSSPDNTSSSDGTTAESWRSLASSRASPRMAFWFCSRGSFRATGVAPRSRWEQRWRPPSCRSACGGGLRTEDGPASRRHASRRSPGSTATPSWARP